MAMSLSTDEVKELVKIQTITDEGATGITRYGSEIRLKWTSSLPVPAPKVGEIWVVTKIASGTWIFDDIIRGDKYNAIHYAMTLDARTCIGRSRAVVDDICRADIDEVYLKVAGNGLVLWDSEVADGYGLKSDGDNVSQVVDRLIANDKSVTFVIDCHLWTASSDEQYQYRQGFIDDEGNIGFDESYCMSYAAAAEPIGRLVDELYELYHDKVRGVCFDNFGSENSRSDFNYKNITEYYDANGKMPDITYVTGEDWSKRFAWLDWNSEMQRRFIAKVKENIGNWPVSCIVNGSLVDITVDDMTGRLSSGIADDISTYGWSLVGLPIKYEMYSDVSLGLRSFEYMVAYGQRLAQSASPMQVVDISEIDAYDGVFEILAKYNATTVLLDGYEKWRTLSDSDVIRLSGAMDLYRVTPKATTDYVGVLVSSDSRDIASTSISENKSWCEGLNTLIGVLLDKLPHRLKVFFDEDIANQDMIEEVSSLMLYHASNMSDDAVGCVEYLLDSEDRNVVIIGCAGSMYEHDAIRRPSLPFVKRFGQAYQGEESFGGYMLMSESVIDITGDMYVLDNPLVGIVPLFDTGGTVAIVDGNQVNAPVFLHRRSSYIGLDVRDNPVIMDLIGDLTLYALGRDGFDVRA